MKKPQTGVLGVFAYLDATLEVIDRLRTKGFPLTVYSPTPLHELEHALDPPESPIRIYTVMGGFTGAGAGLALAIWTSLDWPIEVGGKEIVAIPAFMVTSFEAAILLGALATVAGLFITIRLPRTTGSEEGLYHPSFSVNRFGVFVHVAPEHFQEVQTIMTEYGSEETTFREE